MAFLQICQEITDSCRSNKVVVVGDFNFPNIDRANRGVNGSNGVQFLKCVQEGFLKQYVEALTRERATLVLVLGWAS